TFDRLAEGESRDRDPLQAVVVGQVHQAVPRDDVQAVAAAPEPREQLRRQPLDPADVGPEELGPEKDVQSVPLAESAITAPAMRWYSSS
ncbi:MAG: hypothetical protein ACREMK_16365, partial [Gemmatimonadota bacterium]